MGGEVEKTMQGNTEMPRPGKGRNINNTHITLSPLLKFYILISHSLKLFSTYCFKHWAKFFQVLSFSFFLPGISPFFFLKYILLVMLLQLSHFFLPFIPLHPAPHFPPAFPHFSSWPWVVHISSLVSPYSILFLTSVCLFCACQFLLAPYSNLE